MQELRRNTENRRHTDKLLSPLLSLLPALYFASIVGVITTSLHGSATILLLSTTALLGTPFTFTYLGYHLIDRRNRHLKRQRQFTETLLNAIRQEAENQGQRGLTRLAALIELEAREEIWREEPNKTPWIAIALFIPLLNALTFYYIADTLMNDLHKHEQDEDRLWKHIRTALALTGVHFTPERTHPAIPKRNFVLYMVLSWFTAGAFYPYWLYRLIQDPNNHFKNHAEIEDKLIKTLEQLPQRAEAGWPAS